MKKVVDGITYTLTHVEVHGRGRVKVVDTWVGGPIGGDLRAGARWHVVGTSMGQDHPTFEAAARAVQQRRKKAYEAAKRLVADYQAQLAELGRTE